MTLEFHPRPVYLQILICCHCEVCREGMIKPSFQMRKLRLKERGVMLLGRNRARTRIPDVLASNLVSS